MTRLLSILALLLATSLAPASPAFAQPPPEGEAAAEGESKGDPLYAYIGTALIASLVVFIVCKSARR